MEAHIRDRIVRRGKLTFAEFMGLALYHPCGYYAGASGIGAMGDFFTSPVAHPVFGALLALQLQRMWKILGSPTRFYVVEMGAGSGLLAWDIVDYASRMPGAFSQSLRYLALERYEVANSLTITTGDVCRIKASAEALPLREVVGCFLSNELADAFPVHRFQIKHGSVREVFVTLDERLDFVEVLDEPSTPLIAGHLDKLGLSFSEGFRGEVCLALRPWLTQVSDALAKGFAITIDYGYESRDLYAKERSGGTLRTYHNHTRGDDPYRRVGDQDITAHVDFSLMASEGNELGLKPLALLRQADYLKGLGFQAMLHSLRVREMSQRARDANMMATRELVKEDGLGSFKILIQERNTGVQDALQLVPQHDPKASLVPLLRPEHMPLIEGRYPHLAWDTEGLWPFGDEAS